MIENSIIAVLPLVGKPRHSKRITMLQEAGFEVEAAAFERDYCKGRLPDCPVECLGHLSRRQYFHRGLKMLAAAPRLRRAIRRNRLVYTFNPDVALMAVVAGAGLNRPVVLEVGDIREAQVADGILGRMVRAVDRRMTAACRLLVVTAPAFLDEYYRQWLHVTTPGMVVENKVEASFADDVASKQSDTPLRTPFYGSPLRIGYFGSLRDEWSWQVLKALAIAAPQEVEIIFAGVPVGPLADLPNWIQQYPNMHYHGQYRSPQDLPTLYGNVDMVWACYPPMRREDWNLKWARPNRFYESCLFRKPTFTRAGCHDAVDVKRYNIGMIIDEKDADRTAIAIRTITFDKWNTWYCNMQRLPVHVYSYTNEREHLRLALLRLANNLPPDVEAVSY